MQVDSTLRESLDRDGYAVIRDVFGAGEIACMRDGIEALLATNRQPRRLSNGRNLGPIPPDSDLGRGLLDGRLAWDGMLPREIYVHANTFNGWHADGPPLNRGQQVTQDAAWMYKMVLYLQDHIEQGGFSLIPGSHKEGGPSGAIQHIPTRAGDVVVFHHSIWHAGRLPNPLLANFAWALHRLHLVDDCGRQRLLGIQHLGRSAPSIDRYAIFLLFAPLQEISQRFTAMHSSALT